MALGVVQAWSGPEGTGSSNSTNASGSATVAGNKLVVCVQLYGQGGGSDIPQETGVTDNKGNTFNLIPGSAVQHVSSIYGMRAVYYQATITTGGAGHVISASFNESAYSFLSAWELPASATFDRVVTQPNGSNAGASGTTYPTSPGNLTPTQNGAVLISCANYNQSTTPFTAVEGGWTFNFNGSAGNGSTYNASFAQATAAADACSFTTVGNGNAGSWVASAVSFVPPGSGGGGVLAANEHISGGFVRDPYERLVTVTSAGGALAANEQWSGGFVRDDAGRLMIIASAGGALAAAEQYSGGFVRDAYGRLETVTSGGVAYSGGFMRDGVGRLVIRVDTAGPLSATEQFSGGFIRDSAGNLVTINVGF